jgi:ParB/RepB/Spo0J family partition protein
MPPLANSGDTMTAHRSITITLPDGTPYELTRLLSQANHKQEKGTGYLSVGLTLTPRATGRAGRNLCPFATKGCAATCFADYDRLAWPQNKRVAVARTRLLAENPDRFFALLEAELAAEERQADRRGVPLVCRLNVVSDVAYERECPRLFDAFPRVQFMDYTKDVSRVLNPSRPANYSLTFSRSERNEEDCQRVLAAGHNVTVVFRKPPFPDSFWGYPVIDGDESDLRFLDPRPCIVGLKAKGNGARHDQTGFVLDIAASTTRHPLFVVERPPPRDAPPANPSLMLSRLEKPAFHPRFRELPMTVHLPKPNGATPDSAAESASLAALLNNAEPIEVALADIDFDPANGIKHTEESTERMAASIQDIGLLNPPILSLNGKTGRYFLIAGEGRCRAMLRLGLTKTPARLLKGEFDPQQARDLGLIENLLREDLDPLAFGLYCLDDIQRTGRSVRDLAKLLQNKYSAATISRATRRIGKLPTDLQDMTRNGTLPPAVADLLTGLPDDGSKRELAEQYRNKTLKTRDDVAAAVRSAKHGHNHGSAGSFTCQEAGVRIAITLPAGSTLSVVETALRTVLKDLASHSRRGLDFFKDFLTKKAHAAKKAAELEIARTTLAGVTAVRTENQGDKSAAATSLQASNVAQASN